MVGDRTKDLVNRLNEQELMDLIKSTALDLHRGYRSKNKRSDSEFSASAYSTRAKVTSLYAKTEKSIQVYNGNVQLLKYLVSKL